VTEAESVKAGFPAYSFTPQEKREKLLRLLQGDYGDVIEDGVIRQRMDGLSLASSYFPHMWSIRCGDKLTPMEVYTHHLGDALKRRKALGSSKTKSDLRKALRCYSGAQGCSNFQPIAALALYNRYLPDEGGTVWDMSSGFGGRLLGSLGCEKVLRYIGCDPSSLTHQGLNAMKAELIPMMHAMGYRTPDVQLNHIGSEDFRPKPGSLDLAMTSPPYGSHEKYSDEPTQSYIRFPTNERWINEFMRRTLHNCRVGLKPNGWLVVNIADCESYSRLTSDFLLVAKELGFTLVETLQLSLSKMVGTDKTQSHKYEPVFSFKKR
jgi:hypothetical protein